MSSTDWIALYAAVVATLALGWEVVTYVRERRANIRVVLWLMHFVEPVWDKAGAVVSVIDLGWRL